MRKTFITLTMFTGLALGLVLAYSPRTAAMNGGTYLTTRQERAGIFEIHTYDGAFPGGVCTATVLSSSVATNRTWLITAAHCFSYIDNLYYVYGHFANPYASVRYDMDPDTSGTNEQDTPVFNSRVFVWNEWLQQGGHSAWFGVRDVAVIRVDQAIPIFDENGQRIPEFRRSVYTGPANQVSEPYVSTSMTVFSKNAFCGQGDGNLRCDTLSNLWWSPNFRNQFFQLPFGAWQNNGFYEAGDSGGPLIKYAPALSRQWEGAGGVIDVAMYGAVLGVLQGPTVFCDYFQNANCNPSDGLASRFEGLGNWFQSIAGPAIPQITSWTSVFTNLRGGNGTPTNLTSITEHGYSFPAYAGSIVGLAIDRSTELVYTWYDNGVMNIGFRTDLDSSSQASGPAPIPDTMPTRFFVGAAGRSHSQIVGMMMLAGNAHTWYDDGTYVIGSVDNLASIQGPQPYSLPPGKTPRDILDIAFRSNGGVLAYYRDGTVSAGWDWDLDSIAPPTPFQAGVGRSPEEILGIDTYSSGMMETLFRYPTF